MVKHGAISRSHVYQMLGSKDVRVRRAAFTLLEVSNPRLRRDSELFMEIIRFIWDANPSYDVYREFSKRHLFVPYKVQELIGARIKIEKREEQSAPTDHRTEDARKAGFFKRLFCRRTMQSRTRASSARAISWKWRTTASRDSSPIPLPTVDGGGSAEERAARDTAPQTLRAPGSFGKSKRSQNKGDQARKPASRSMAASSRR
jgi:hypothetical protein